MTEMFVPRRQAYPDSRYERIWRARVVRVSDDLTKAWVIVANLATHHETGPLDIRERLVEVGDSLLISFAAADARDPVIVGATRQPDPVVDHGALTGLADDDHPQYLTAARHDADGHSSLDLDHYTSSDFGNDHDAVPGDHVTGGNSHNHAGGDGAQVDHGALGGTGDDDHPQYLNTPRHAGIIHDHGSLSGLSDDDHSQYLLADGSRAVDGSALILNDGLVVIGDAQVTGLLEGDGGLDLQGNATIQGDLAVTGDVSFTGNPVSSASMVITKGSDQGVSSSTWTKVAIAPGANLVAGTAWGSTSNRDFEVPRDGWYACSATVTLDGVATATRVLVSLHSTGDATPSAGNVIARYDGESGATSAIPRINIAGHAYLTTADVVNLYVYSQNTSSTIKSGGYTRMAFIYLGT